MDRLRKTSLFVRLLVGLFVIAQFSGVISSPRSGVRPVGHLGATVVDHEHFHDHGAHGAPQLPHDDGNLGDTCCALHAYFAGVLPPAVAVGIAGVVAERLNSSPNDRGSSIPPDRLDRPPRPSR